MPQFIDHETQHRVDLPPEPVVIKRLLLWLEPLFETIGKGISKGDFWIAGGCLTTAFHTPYQCQIIPNDIDIFCKTRAVYEKLGQNMKALEGNGFGKINVKPISFFVETNLDQINLSVKQVTPTGMMPNMGLDDDQYPENYSYSKGNSRVVTLNVINMSFTSMESCIYNFDFLCNSMGIGYLENQRQLTFIAKGHAVLDAQKKYLTPLTISNPVGTMKRLCKYSAKGFTISYEDLQKLLKMMINHQETTDDEYF